LSPIIYSLYARTLPRKSYGFWPLQKRRKSDWQCDICRWDCVAAKKGYQTYSTKKWEQ
jgi:hypothetical protein